MNKLKLGDRVKTNHEFLSEGFISKVIKSPLCRGVFAYIIKLDVKAPNEYAYETDEVVMFPEEIKRIEE